MKVFPSTITSPDTNNILRRSMKILSHRSKLPHMCTPTLPQLFNTYQLRSSRSTSHHLVYGLPWKQFCINRTPALLTWERWTGSKHFISPLSATNRQKAATYQVFSFFQLCRTQQPSSWLFDSYFCTRKLAILRKPTSHEKYEHISQLKLYVINIHR